ncbi:MAG: porin family protein [Bacteroidota bacterium]
MMRVTQLFTLLLLVAFTLPSLDAQVAVGFRGGAHVAYNNLSFDHNYSDLALRDNITGLIFAIPVEWPASRMFRLQTGLAFLTRGTRIYYSDPSAELDYVDKYAISYIQIPITGKLALDLNPFDLYVIGGVDLAYGVDFELLQLSYDGTGPKTLRQRKLDFERAGISRLDVGLALGGGVETTISKGRRIFLDVRFHIGLNDIDARSDVEVFNQGRSYTLGMLLPINFKKQKVRG